MTPQFFGSSDRPLYGVYHPPRISFDHAAAEGRGRAVSRPRDAAVLLCYPGPYEYMLTHWAFRNLAGMLSREGFHVFRFDYTGTGDSAGDVAEWTLEQWQADVRTAADELRDLSGARKLSLVGMRLGAVLALGACAAGLAAKELVLWEPIIRGAAYVAELEEVERARIARGRQGPRHGGSAELLGFPLPATTRRALEAIDLLVATRPTAERLVLVTAEPGADFTELRSTYAESRVPLEYLVVEEEAGPDRARQGALLSNSTLRAITAALTERRS